MLVRDSGVRNNGRVLRFLREPDAAPWRSRPEHSPTGEAPKARVEFTRRLRRCLAEPALRRTCSATLFARLSGEDRRSRGRGGGNVAEDDRQGARSRGFRRQASGFRKSEPSACSADDESGRGRRGSRRRRNARLRGLLGVPRHVAIVVTTPEAARYSSLMSDGARKLPHDAIELPVAERAEPTGDLLASLDCEPDGNVEPAWATEIELRAREALANPDDDEPWEIVRAELYAGS